MSKVVLTLDSIVGGGQAIGKSEDGKKVFVWGGLPGEQVEIETTRRKSSYDEGLVTQVLRASDERIEPKDPGSYLSTSPWQIMALEAEQHYKAALIEEAFELHDIVLPVAIGVYTDGRDYEYRNKVEFSFWFDTDTEKLSLAFFRRGSHGKIAVDGTSLASSSINNAAQAIVEVLNSRKIGGRAVKTLLIRCDREGNIAWQLYVKDKTITWSDILNNIIDSPALQRGEIIFSNPKSPASVITERLTPVVEPLSDTILDVPFRYATEGFFQINLPVYEEALRDMQKWVPQDTAVVDLYSGVGTIGLTIGGENITLVESSEPAVREMEQNITELGRKNAKAVLAPSEKALEYITTDATIIVDPPRAGLHQDVIDRLLEAAPGRIIYLSCNPVTQARDVMRLSEKYGVRAHRGYNFFPRTPHIEHLVILDLKP